MQETLEEIHTTLASFDPGFHDRKLDDLEKRRYDAIQALSAAFSSESELLSRKRKAEREIIAEQRRKEDEEREKKRLEEDQELAARDHDEDVARDGKLREETEKVELETDSLMHQVEEEARVAVAQGREKLQALQERRRVSTYLCPQKSGPAC